MSNDNSTAAGTETVLIDRVVDGGAGLGRLQSGEIVLIADVLPGEHVTLDSEKLIKRKGVARAAADAITAIGQPAAGRIEPVCPHVADGCGGCDATYVAVETQRQLKREIVMDSLRRIAKMQPDEVDTIVAESVDGVTSDRYRSTLRLHRDQQRKTGFHRIATHDVVGIGACLVGLPALDALITASGQLHPSISEVTIRTSADTGQSLVILTTNWRANDPHEVAKLVALFPPNTNLVLSTSRALRTLKGQPFLFERVANRRFRVSALSFFQSGPAAAELLSRAVNDSIVQGNRLAGLGEHESIHVADLYAGVGMLGACAVDDARLNVTELSVVEQSKSSVSDAKVNLADTDAGISIFEGDAASFGAADFASPVDVVIADPAREGLGSRGVAAIVDIDPRVVVLVGCEPAAFARDVAGLTAEGYTLASVQVLDLFAQTWHVESVGLLVGQHRG